MFPSLALGLDQEPSVIARAGLPELKSALDALDPVASLGLGEDRLLVERRAPDRGEFLRERHQ